jgi:spore germination cell wall hydrolase CwlJ-like protein
MMAEPVRRKGLVQEYAPYVFGGFMMVAAFAFAGHQIGRNASAHTALPDILVPAEQQRSSISEKSSLLLPEENFALVDLNLLRRQTADPEGKGDMIVMDPGEAPEPAPRVIAVKPVVKPEKKVAAAVERRLHIEPAAVNLKDEPAVEPKAAVKRLAIAPKPANIDSSFKLKKAEKQKIVAQRRVRLAEENCLARAVYFEARSESEMGQLAVAKVILNRVKSPDYPNTICGVVYQGSNRRNSCQFSFACDGQPDDVKQPEAWLNSKRVAQRALAGDSIIMKKLGSNVVNYHADYVRPKWSRAMRRAVKIGRHIFYKG